MKKKLSRILSLAMCAAVILTLAACGGSGGSGGRFRRLRDQRLR